MKNTTNHLTSYCEMQVVCFSITEKLKSILLAATILPCNLESLTRAALCMSVLLATAIFLHD